MSSIDLDANICFCSQSFVICFLLLLKHRKNIRSYTDLQLEKGRPQIYQKGSWGPPEVLKPWFKNYLLSQGIAAKGRRADANVFSTLASCQMEATWTEYWRRGDLTFAFKLPLTWLSVHCSAKAHPCFAPAKMIRTLASIHLTEEATVRENKSYLCNKVLLHFILEGNVL